MSDTTLPIETRLTLVAGALEKGWNQDLPLSVRYAAARAADAVVYQWMAEHPDPDAMDDA